MARGDEDEPRASDEAGRGQQSMEPRQRELIKRALRVFEAQKKSAALIHVPMADKMQNLAMKQRVVGGT